MTDVEAKIGTPRTLKYYHWFVATLCVSLYPQFLGILTLKKFIRKGSVPSRPCSSPRACSKM